MAETGFPIWRRRSTHLIGLAITIVALAVSFMALWGRNRNRQPGDTQQSGVPALIEERDAPEDSAIKTATFALG